MTMGAKKRQEYEGESALNVGTMASKERELAETMEKRKVNTR